MRDMLLSLLIQDFPESFIITLFCFSFLRLRWRWRQIFSVTLLLTLTNLIRLLPVAFGIHSVILVSALGIYLNTITKVPLSKTFTAAIFCLLIAVITQGSYYIPLLKLTGLSSGQVESSPWLRSMFSTPFFTVLLAAALGRHLYNRKRQNFLA